MNLWTTQAGCLAILGAALTCQAADTKVEFRLAETRKADGLVEAKVAGSKDTVYLRKEAVLTNADIAAARIVKDEVAGDQLQLEFTAEGAKKMETASAKHIGKPLAVLIDGKVVCAPIVREKMSKTASLSGKFTREELERLVRDLKPR